MGDASSPPRMHAYDGPVSQDPERLSALPSVAARVIAFVSILVGGLAGALVGYALSDLNGDGGALAHGIGILLGASIAAGGTAIVAVLVLRAAGEWREMADRR